MTTILRDFTIQITNGEVEVIWERSEAHELPDHDRNAALAAEIRATTATGLRRGYIGGRTYDRPSGTATPAEAWRPSDREIRRRFAERFANDYRGDC